MQKDIERSAIMQQKQMQMQEVEKKEAAADGPQTPLTGKQQVHQASLLDLHGQLSRAAQSAKSRAAPAAVAVQVPISQKQQMPAAAAATNAAAYAARWKLAVPPLLSQSL